MKSISILVWAPVCALPAPACRAQKESTTAALESLSALIGGQHQAEVAGPALGLEEVERIALAENPEIHVALRRAAAAESHVLSVGTLGDPQFMYRGRGGFRRASRGTTTRRRTC
jgi:hypothetical protein